MSDSPLATIRLHARSAPWNAKGLATHANGLLDAAGMRPTSAVARAALSGRAVRFYVANGLLDRPDGRGTAATYGYRHLLQLLAIKIRQREGQTLDVIRRELSQQTGDALERRVAQVLFPAIAAQAAREEAGDGTTGTWRRVPVASGIELHVKSDHSAADDSTLELIRTAIRGVIARDADG